MNFFGGDVSSGLSATTTAAGSTNTLIDTNRPEPDDEWDSSWIVLNPGSSDQVNKPTIWRKVADTGGYIQSTGTITILGTWPSPYSAGVPSGTSYELYKTFRPEQWLQGINYALLEAYPHRHRAISAEIPQNSSTRLLDYGFLGKQITAIPNPSSAPTVTEITDGTGAFQPGTYTFAYSLYNDFGDTLPSPTSTLTVVGTNSRVQFANITNVPSSAFGAKFYGSMQPGDAAMDQLNIGQSAVTGIPTTINFPGSPTTPEPGQNINGTIYSIAFQTPNPYYGVAPPQYNTTTVDFFRLHKIYQRINPSGYPEIFNELPASYWKDLGGTKALLMYMPVNQFNLMLIMTTQVPILSAEIDVSQEPAELIYWGAEAYLWDLLTKISQIVNSAWEKLGTAAEAKYEKLKNDYKMDIPRDYKRVPVIRPQY